MKNEDTFSLTSLKDDHQQFLNKPLSKSKLKLPSIKSQTSLSKATTASKTLTSPSSQPSVNIKRSNQNSMTHDLLKSITERACQ